MTTTLLLGANGFLGSQMHDALLREGDGARVVAVSARPPLHPTTPATTWRRMDLAAASTRQYAELLRWSRPDAVINCAGCTAGHPAQLEAANVSVVDKLVRALAGHDPVPLVHLGSAAEYGTQPEGIPIKETAVARPEGPYGRTKLEATDLVVSTVSRGAIRATVLRVFNPVGPRSPRNSLAGTASQEIRQALASSRRSVTLGALWPHRDFLASHDVVTAALRVVRDVDPHPILNVGRGVAMSCRSMVELLADAAGFDGDIFESPGGSLRSAAVPWQQANIGLLRRHLEWVPTTSIAEAVSALWQSGR